MAEQTLDTGFDTNALVQDPDRDLGFGSVVSGQSRQRLLNADPDDLDVLSDQGKTFIGVDGVSFLTGH